MELLGKIRAPILEKVFREISRQRVTGILHLRSNHDDVRVAFLGGLVVSAESTNRPREYFLGTMLLKAGLITPAQLDTALVEQRRRPRRIGSILVELRSVTDAQI